MPSQLTFASTESFRNKLLVKNLSPYTVPGVYNPPAGNIVHETILTVSNVIDSPDNLIADDVFADVLYPLNAYGPNGGYNKNINAGGLANTQSNLGPYDFSDAKLPQLSQGEELKVPTRNKYSSSSPLDLISLNNIIQTPLFKQYAEPLSFVPSTYTPYSILTSNNPSGSDGNLSQDSFIIQLGAKELQKILKKTQASVTSNNLSNSNAGLLSSILGGATDPLRGNTNLSNSTYKITVDTSPENINGNFLARLQGTYLPSSPIPGDYFEDEQYSRQSATVNQISNALNIRSVLGPINQFLGPKVIRSKSPSEVFLKNTGSGQSSQLFRNLNYNKYKPNYNRNLAQDFLQGALNVLGVSNKVDVPTNYYVGSSIQDPSFVNSPLGQVPVDSLGRDTQAIVLGPSEMSKLYENNSTNELKIGLNGGSYTDGYGITDGLVWVSPKYNNAGYKATVGGDQGPQGPSYNEIRSQIEPVLSTEFNYKEDSIMDNTQKILDSTPKGSKRLSHVGNAINQLSKVFNDGYKEITKGSRIVGYSNPSKGSYESDNVYCRVFTKDTPYLTYADLQKTDGNIRKFTYSVLDNTYNLNIAPLKNPGSTNIVDGKVKKYMFSIENLAWRTSNRPGLTYNDLPVCERGPNGGRVMWFPPYDISFSETITPSFQDNNFLGRPEPIYTYTNTKRSGQLSWKIIVDHPSILNVIVDKELKDVKGVEKLNSIVDSFFAGCLKYDIYELAKRWNTIPTDQLFVLQQTITNSIVPEDIKQVSTEVQTVGGGTPTTVDTKTNDVNVPDFGKYENLGFYFDNDYPNPKTTSKTTTANFETEYNRYIGLQSTYQTNAPANSKDGVKNFFSDVVIDNFNNVKNDLVKDITAYFDVFKELQGQQPKLEITLVGSASAPNTKSYNVNLSARRVDSVKNYFSNVNGGVFKEYIKNGFLVIKNEGTLGEQTTVTPKTGSGKNVGNGFNCTDNDPATNKSTEIYTVKAMACRRVAITKINPTKPQPVNGNSATEVTQSGPGQSTGTKPPPGYQSASPVPPTITTTQKIKDGISKKILRYLLSECDYFELVKESNPMYYDSIKEKIKYFSPAFHSMTPEGLNSRLTFLQQCARPGDTIPIIGSDGKPKYNSSVNTNFGAPPVLVLRIGDFYNSKIIPTSLGIAYEPLIFDLNPEGIGVQPMIAKITMGFNFVGGQGLKEPIDKLQNALSFNFYGNTEMYDDRADFTDDSFKKIDADIVKSIIGEQPVVGVNDVKNNLQNEGGQTIGTIQDKFVGDTSQSGSTATTVTTSGTITYQKIMDSMITAGQSYIDSVSNKTVQLVKDFNLPINTLFTSERNYYYGSTREFVNPQLISIYGKNKNMEQRLTALFNKVVSDIENENFYFIKVLKQEDFKTSTIKQVKTNLINEVKNTQSIVQTSLTMINQELTTNQQTLTRVFRKLDIVDTKTDGFIKSDQSVKIYNISATTEVLAGSAQNNTYDELVEDYKSGTTKLYSFYNDILKQNGFVEKTFDLNNIELKGNGDGFVFGACPDCTNAEKRFYTAMSKIILDKNSFLTFRSNVIPESIAQEPRGGSGGLRLIDVFDNEFNGRIKTYGKEHDEEVTFVDKQLTSPYKKTYNPWSPFVANKVRKFTFDDIIDGTTDQKTRLQNLYKDGNSNTEDKTFNGKNKFN